LEGFEAQGYETDIWPAAPAHLYGSSAAEGNLKQYYRNPIEVNWDISVQFDHDFPGKKILQELKANPKRKTTTLVWNKEDVIDIFASNFLPGVEPYKWMDYPVHNYNKFGVHYEQDNVYDKSGKLIGYSSLTSYSNYSRKVLSLGTIDVEYLPIGTAVEILWGDPGHPQKKVRAIVSKYPYLDLPLNMHYDIESVPHVNKKE
jgi:glycine cleavage system aminomethyltransferase T